MTIDKDALMAVGVIGVLLSSLLMWLSLLLEWCQQ